VEPRSPAAHNSSGKKGGRGEMTKSPIGLQDLRRKIYAKAKAEPAWRFWGLYVHVCKLETLQEAYKLAKRNNGAPGVDGVSFKAIEEAGTNEFLSQIRGELVEGTYRPLRVRKVGIPKSDGKTRTLSIPAIRDRVVQGALKLILEPIFEADFQPGSFGYRPKKSAKDAVYRVSEAIVSGKTHVLDLDLRAYFDNVKHHIVFEKVAQRVDDKDIMRLLKQIMKATGKRGVPQGGVISPLLSNIYLNEVDRMLEKAKEVSKSEKWYTMEYARYADDLVVLVHPHPNNDWLRRALTKRLREEFAKLQVEVNEEKSRTVDLRRKGDSFNFLGFQFFRVQAKSGKWAALRRPQTKKRTDLKRKLKKVFRSHRSQPVNRVIEIINPILAGWVRYFAIGNASRAFADIRYWVEKKVRRHLSQARGRKGFGWKRWSTRWLHEVLGLFEDYRLERPWLSQKASPER
jgi:RNA-directed DNA polymerase